MTATKPKIVPDFHVVGLDLTPHYNIAEGDKQYIAKIVGVYLFDRNRHVHCTELTPSYELWHLYTTVFTTEAVEEIADEEERDRLRGRLDEDYAYEETEAVEYHHVRNIDGLIPRLTEKRLYAHYGPPTGTDGTPARDDFDEGEEGDEEWYKALVEKLREHYQGNPPF